MKFYDSTLRGPVSIDGQVYYQVIQQGLLLLVGVGLTRRILDYDPQGIADAYFPMRG